MITITLSAKPTNTGYQASIAFFDSSWGPKPWVSMHLTDPYPTIGEAMTAAASKLLSMPERLKALDHMEGVGRQR